MFALIFLFTNEDACGHNKVFLFSLISHEKVYIVFAVVAVVFSVSCVRC
jgi:hypothetical protein